MRKWILSFLFLFLCNNYVYAIDLVGGTQQITSLSGTIKGDGATIDGLTLTNVTLPNYEEGNGNLYKYQADNGTANFGKDILTYPLSTTNVGGLDVRSFGNIKRPSIGTGTPHTGTLDKTYVYETTLNTSQMGTSGALYVEAWFGRSTSVANITLGCDVDDGTTSFDFMNATLNTSNNGLMSSAMVIPLGSTTFHLIKKGWAADTGQSNNGIYTSGIDNEITWNFKFYMTLGDVTDIGIFYTAFARFQPYVGEF